MVEIRLQIQLLEAFGNSRKAQRRKQHARRAGGIAVGILPRARGDIERPGKIAVAVQQAECHIGAVQTRVDIEAPQRTIRTDIVLVPLVLE